MTHRTPEAATFLRMTRNPIRRPWLVVLSLLLPLSPIRAEEPVLRDLLRDALYTEEVARDPEKAAQQYEELLSRHAEQKQFAASALFRLAEVRRKQNRKDDAIALYQRLLTEFPNAEAETRLAKENLAALGGKAPSPGAPVIDDETKEIARLESLAKSSPDILLDPKTIEEAVGKGWTKVVEYLLAAGSPPYAGTALRTAAEKGHLEIVKRLTAGSAAVPEGLGTAAIEAAIWHNRSSILEFLLQRGVKPGNMPGKYAIPGEASALSYALVHGKQRFAELLLKHGADLNALSPASGVRLDGSNQAFKYHGTPLHLMIAKGDFTAANWLLDQGAKPDIPSEGFGITPLHYAAWQEGEESLAMMQRLLEAGADPNRAISAEKDDSSYSRGPSLIDATPLKTAILSSSKAVEKARLLLKHGADPNWKDSAGHSLLMILVESGKGPQSMECLKLLVAAGTKPEDAWMKNGFAGASVGAAPPDAWRYLIEKFTIPGLVNESEIVLIKGEDGGRGMQITRIATRSADSTVPDLAAWMVANHRKITWAAAMDGEPVEYHWSLWRKGGDGTLTNQELDITGGAPLPTLQWGDVIALQPNETARRMRISYRDYLPSEILWHFRKRVSFPITVEIEGKPREIIVRGDRIVFDPTKNEVPLNSLQQVMAFLWPFAEGLESAPSIHVSRKGWPDVQLSFGSMEAQKFELEAGDRVKLEIPNQVRDNLAKNRKNTVSLKADGYPFARTFSVPSGGKPVEASIPTLIQALVESQASSWSSWMGLLGKKTLEPAVFMEEIGAYQSFSLLPHPDLSHIRIRRLQEDGTEKVIEVNLAKTIAESSDQTTSEEARKADVLLQAGDIVEISPIKDRFGEPWKGIGPKEEMFFAKALSGRVRVTYQDGNMTVRDLVFRAPRFIETECGWLPVPPETGMPSMRGSWLTQQDSEMVITRGNPKSESLDSSQIFLRDGDELRVGNLRVTRLRVVPPPPQSR